MMRFPTYRYRGSTFREVRDLMFSDPYETLPQNVVTLGSFYKGIKNKLFKAAQRALDDSSDTGPYFQRLIHPNGIALAGTWQIKEDSPYSGYFKKGSKGLIIVRSSVVLSKTKQGQNRGFAFAGKIFPTMDPDERVKTADFFTIDVLLGTKARYFTDVSLTNEVPPGFNLDIIRLFGIIISSIGTLVRADFNAFYRPTYPVAELGLAEGEESNAPKWMMIKAWSGNRKVDRADFRDELRVENYKDGELFFNISVASKKLLSGGRDWQYIGYIKLTESVTSESCDHRLVFQHPKLKKKNKKN